MRNHRTTSQQVRLTTDQLILNAQPFTPKESQLTATFDRHFHDNPVAVPYFIGQSKTQIRTAGWYSFDLSYAYALVHLHIPGGPEYKLPHQIKSWYARTCILCCPELNGKCELRRSSMDKVFGLRVADTTLPGDYGRRLEWFDGSPLSSPQPTFCRAQDEVQRAAFAAGKSTFMLVKGVYRGCEGGRIVDPVAGQLRLHLDYTTEVA
jgi:hypothetical protein